MRRIAGLAAVVSLLSFSLLADDKKKDPDEIGNRDVGKGLNWYSVEKEIALGKQLAQQVEPPPPQSAAQPPQPCLDRLRALWASCKPGRRAPAFSWSKT